jgi:outer membrane beta-barrel protein
VRDRRCKGGARVGREERRCIAIAAGLAALIAAAPSARAERPSEAPLPSCLDQSIADELGERIRPRGVQKREFLKNGKLQVVGRGGLFAADLLSSSYVYGGALAFYFTEDLALELSFDVTPVALDLDEPVAGFFGDNRFEPSTGYLALAGLLWSPIHAKLKIGDSIVHSDILLAAGAGRLFHDSVQGVTFDAGLILELYTSGWLTFRFDVRDVVAVQEAVAETRLTNNIIATMGLSLWIPTGL